MTTTLIASATGMVNIEGEHDWFKAVLDANTLYAFSISGLSDQDYSTIGVGLFNADGELENLTFLTGASNSSFMTAAAGTYYFDVGSYYSLTSFGDYTLNLATSPDDYRNNTSTSGAIAIGGTANGVIDVAGDHDWFKLDLTAGTLYAITATSQSLLPGSVMVLQIMDSTGAYVNADDAAGGGALGFMPAASASYYIDVSSSFAENYSVSVVASPDDYQNNTSTSGAVAVGGSTTGVINTAGDHDWFAVSLTANVLYELNTTGPESYGTSLAVFGANGAVVEDLFGTLSESSGAFMTDVSGTYFIEVSSPQAGAYELMVATSPDDYFNNTATTGTVSVGGSVQGTINLEGDQDWFKVNLSANTLYAIGVSGLSPLGYYSEAFLDMRDATGAPLTGLDAYGFGGEGALGFMPAVSGSYFIEVSSFLSTGESVDYTLSMSTSPDDYYSNVATSGTVAVGASVGGNINTAGDHDWFQVSLAANTLYAITTTGVEPHSLLIYDASGAPVGALDTFGVDALGFMPVTSGSYYIDVGSLSAGAIGAYTLQVAQAEDDFANNASTVGVLATGVSPPTTPQTIIGTASSESFNSGAGNDTIDGGLGADTVVYLGNRSGYHLSKSGNGFQVADQTPGRNGTDNVQNVETLHFADMSVDLTIGALAASIPASDLKTLQELYVGFFNRVPEAAGLSYWIGQLKAGVSLADIADQFYGAGVQFGVYSATMTDAQFITTVYANVLGRTGDSAPDANEIGYWANRLNSLPAQDTKGTMVLSMLHDSHAYFTNDPVVGWVIDLLDNKAEVANYFAVQQGLSYNVQQDNITYGIAIAAAITPTDTADAIALIGVNAFAMV